MTLPVGTISMSQVNTELGLGATTNISLNQANVRTLAGVPSGTISMNDLRGKSAFTLGFIPSGPSFYSTSIDYSDYALSGFSFDPNGNISFNGKTANDGPLQWASPPTAGMGSQYEFRVIINYVITTMPGCFLSVADGPDYYNGFSGTTPWFTINNNNVGTALYAFAFTQAALGEGGSVESQGTVEIRKISGGPTITKPYYVTAYGTVPERFDP